MSENRERYWNNTFRTWDELRDERWGPSLDHDLPGIDLLGPMDLDRVRDVIALANAMRDDYALAEREAIQGE